MKLLTPSRVESRPKQVDICRQLVAGLRYRALGTCSQECTIAHPVGCIATMQIFHSADKSAEAFRVKLVFTGLFQEKATGRRLPTAPCAPETNSVKTTLWSVAKHLIQTTNVCPSRTDNARASIA